MKRVGLRVLLVGFVVLTLAPVLGLLTFDRFSAREKLLRDLEADAVRLTEQIAARQAAVVEEAGSDLSIFARLPAVARGDWGQCAPMFEDILKALPAFTNIGVVDADGWIRCSGQPISQPVFAGDRDWYVEAIATRNVSVGSYQIGRITGKPAINIGYPLIDDYGGLVGVAYVAAGIDHLFSELDIQAISPAAKVTLTDSLGTVLASRGPNAVSIGTDISTSALYAARRAVSNGIQSASQMAGLDGIERFYSVAPVESAGRFLGWLFVGIPLAEGIAEINRKFLTGLAVILTISIAGLGVGWWLLSRTVIRPAGILVGAAARIGSGDLTARALSAGAVRELARLAGSFDSMAQSLEQNIRRRDEVEWQLHSLNQRLQAVIQSSPVAIAIADIQDRTTEWNPAAERITGWTAEEKLGHQFDGVGAVPEDGLERFREAQSAVRSGQVVRDWEARRLKKDGTEYYAIVSKAPLHNARGEVIGYFTMAMDVTERRRAENALRESESQLSLLYANVSDVIYFLAVEPGELFRFVSVNAAFFKATGLTEAQVIGKLVQEVIPEPAHELVLSRYREAIREKSTVRWEEVSVYPTGAKHGAVAVTPIFDASGRCTNLAGTVHDVTERKRMEAEISEQNAELERRVADRTDQLEAANHELQSFAYSVSHDLRAPLRAIDGFSQALLEDYLEKLDDQGQDFLNRVRNASQFMGQLIDGLLKLSRVTRAEVYRQEVDLSAMGESIADALRKAQPERQVTFSISSGLTAHGDPILLRAVLENLLGNAWKFTSKRPAATIEFGTTWHDGMQVYLVRDDGAGFDMAYADKLFAPFQRLHTRGEFEGTGIGLATVQRVINRHGGRVWPEGHVGQGATFYFTLGQ